MSDAALEAFTSVKSQQLYRNEARRIRTKINDARNSPHQAGVRWPFELLQNATDFGPRHGRSSVEVKVRYAAGILVVEHDGPPFTMEDLAALLSGGSSKDFEGDDTTGRFGTGFLVTHVLSVKTRITGLLQTEDGLEEFSLTLERGGSEEDILQNTQDCNEAIRNARRVEDVVDKASVRLEYYLTNPDAMVLGFQRLRDAMPYLYSTCQHLGHVTIEDETGSESWSAGAQYVERFEAADIISREVTRTTPLSVEELLSLRSTMQASPGPAIVVVARRADTSWHIALPPAKLPRLFRTFPIGLAHPLPTQFVLDGPFDVDQERSKIHLNDHDEALVRSGLAPLRPLLLHSLQSGYSDAHRLATIGAHAWTPDHEERDWWASLLGAAALDLSYAPLVQTRNGYVPANPQVEGASAHFVSPRLSLTESSRDETSVGRLWKLIDDTDDLLPPVADIAADWSAIARSWSTLGIETEQVTVGQLVNKVRDSAGETLDTLPVRIGPHEWLVHLLETIGECWEIRGGGNISLLDGLLPDQYGALKSPGRLRRDLNLPPLLKSIAADAGLDVASELLDNRLASVALDLGLARAQDVIRKVVPEAYTEEQLVENTIRALGEECPDGSSMEDSHSALFSACLRLLQYLWQTRREEGTTLARRCPLGTAAGHFVHWAETRPLMAPAATWHPLARPFVQAYPPQRVLADSYADEGESADLVRPLLTWGLAIPDPLHPYRPAELKDSRLAGAALPDQDVTGITVTGATFNQLALLQPELINRSREGFEEAAALLGLVLCYLARQDTSWRDFQEVTGRKAGESMQLQVRRSLWLADLTTRAWVPTLGEGGRIESTLASKASLESLLDPSWLVGNSAAIELLASHFGFDALELRLLGAFPDPDKRIEVRNGLAHLVEAAGEDTEVYLALADELQQRRRRAEAVSLCRSLGLAVQEAVRAALESCGLSVTLVDRGFDFEVQAGETLEEIGVVFPVESFLLEVKATTHGEVRLTPLQAQTAASHIERFVLCVVDLRDVSAERLAQPWAPEDVQPLTHCVDDIGVGVHTTWSLIENARAEDVSIRNEQALRYGISSDTWEQGVTIHAWVRGNADRFGT